MFRFSKVGRVYTPATRAVAAPMLVSQIRFLVLHTEFRARAGINYVALSILGKFLAPTIS